MLLRNVVKGTLVLSFMSIITQIGSLLLLPVYSHIIAPDFFGAIGLLAPFTTITLVIFNLGFPTAQARELVDFSSDSSRLGSYLFSIHLALLVASVLGFALLLFPPSRSLIIRIFGIGNVDFHYIVLAYLTGILMAFVNMINVYYNFTREYTRRAIASVLAFLLSNILALSIIFTSADGALGKLAGAAIAQLVILCFLGRQYFSKFSLPFERSYLVNSLAFGVPMVATGLFTTLSNTGNRFIMNQFLSLDQIGQYTIAWTITTPINFIYSSFQVVWMPIFFEVFTAKTHQEIEKYIITIATLICAFILIIQLFIKDISIIFLSSQYYEAINLSIHIFPFLLPLALSGLFSNYLLFFRKPHLKTTVYFFTSVFTILANFILVPIYGVSASIDLLTITEVMAAGSILGMISLKFHLRFKYWVYIVLIFLPANPITISIAEQQITTMRMLSLKVVYAVLVLSVLFWLLPMKKRWFALMRQLPHKSKLLLRN